MLQSHLNSRLRWRERFMVAFHVLIMVMDLIKQISQRWLWTWQRKSIMAQEGQPPQGSGQEPNKPPSGRGRGSESPPDLDEIWRDFTKKLNGLLGAKKSSPSQPPHGNRGNNGQMLSIIAIAVSALSLLWWVGSGFFIVQEGQQAVITQFGRFHSTVGAGFQWRLPYPIQQHETVASTQIRSVDVGKDVVKQHTGFRGSAMLTEDENIVEIKFAVQYRLSDPRQFIFNSRDPEQSVVSAAESAVREVVGKMKMDAVLADERDQIAPRVRTLMQKILDNYKVGIEIIGINLQQGGVRPPEQVQAAFDDVLKAGQEKEKTKNEAQAYANEVVPKAKGTAARLLQEAEGYKAKVMGQAEGDANRFSSLLTEYQKAPQTTRERLYTEAMEEVLGNVNKILIDTKANSQMLYLPLDKLIQQNSPVSSASTSSSGTSNATPVTNTGNSSSSSINTSNTSNTSRSRDRDIR